MKIKYDSTEHTHVSIAEDDIDYKISGVTSIHREWRTLVQPFSDGGGVIESYEDSISLEDYKTTAIEVNQAEAGNRIALLFGTVEEGYIANSTKLINKQINNVVEGVKLTLKVADRTVVDADHDRLDILGALMDSVDAIRDAENTAAASINLVPETDDMTIDKAAVDAISVSWP